MADDFETNEQERDESSQQQENEKKKIGAGTVILFIIAFSIPAFFLLTSPWPFGSNEQIVQTPLPTPSPESQPQQQTQGTEDFTLSEVEGWQTYRSDEFGFETQIPEEWEPAQNTDNSLVTLDVIPSKPHDNVRFEVSLESISSDEDFSTWFQRESEFSEVNMKEAFDVANSIYGEGFINMEDFSVVIEDSQIGGSPTKVQTINCLKDDCYFGGPQNHKEYYIKNEDTIYVFKVWTLNPNKDFSLLDQILSTFRFVDTGSSESGKIGEGVKEALQIQGEAHVVVALVDPTATQTIASLQDDVLGSLNSAEFSVRVRFSTIPGFSGTVLLETALDKLASHPYVTKVDLDVGGGN